MPFYEFVCDKCKISHEEFAKIADGPPKVVCACGEDMHQDYSGGSGFILKGGGWAGKEAKLGHDYDKRFVQRGKDDEKMHNIDVAQKENDEIMSHRRKGRKASNEHKKRNAKMWERYSKNKRKGWAKDKK
jgi:putative FmdB family regulatory protein